MSDSLKITQDEIIRLQQFHRQHFPDQAVPTLQATQEEQVLAADPAAEADLGYYPDGVRRTLTDAQVSMFRHSEIQRLLADRRRKQEHEEQRLEQSEIQRQRARRQQDLSNREITIFDNDNEVHARADVQQLSYDEEHKADVKKDKPTTFQWPILRS